jgi:hypothetical protein
MDVHTDIAAGDTDIAAGNQDRRKLSSKKTKGLKRVPVRLDATDHSKLRTLRTAYYLILGREVSTTVMVRRALDLLAERALLALKDAEAAEGERAAMLANR